MNSGIPIFFIKKFYLTTLYPNERQGCFRLLLPTGYINIFFLKYKNDHFSDKYNNHRKILTMNIK